MSLADSVGQLAQAIWELAEPQRAFELGSHALSLYRQMGNGTLEARALNILGAFNFEVGQNQPALDSFLGALQLFRKLEDRWGEAAGLHNLAALEWRVGRTRDALARADEVLVLWRLLGDKAGEAATLNVLANVQRTLGNHLLRSNTRARHCRCSGRAEIKSEKPRHWWSSPT